MTHANNSALDSNQPVIDIHNLSKQYRDPRLRKVEAIKDITFGVQAGEAFGFIGPNGAGKSTTIKIITGIIFPSSGTVKLMGLPVENPASRKGVAYVPENPSLYDYLTPIEILTMGCRLHGIKKKSLDAHCLEWLERFDIAKAAHRRLRTLSKGMQQRTALAHALAVEPKLLILDEPLSGLDPIGRKDVVNILLEYRHNGGSLLFSSHVLHDVERLADRFGLIHKGVLRTVQRPDELIGSEGTLIVRTIGTQPISSMKADVGGRWYTETPSSQLWSLLHDIEKSGHTILEIKSSISLEKAFMLYVSENNPS